MLSLPIHGPVTPPTVSVNIWVRWHQVTADHVAALTDGEDQAGTSSQVTGMEFCLIVGHRVNGSHQRAVISVRARALERLPSEQSQRAYKCEDTLTKKEMNMHPNKIMLSLVHGERFDCLTAAVYKAKKKRLEYDAYASATYTNHSGHSGQP